MAAHISEGRSKIWLYKGKLTNQLKESRGMPPHPRRSPTCPRQRLLVPMQVVFGSITSMVLSGDFIEEVSRGHSYEISESKMLFLSEALERARPHHPIEMLQVKDGVMRAKKREAKTKQKPKNTFFLIQKSLGYRFPSFLNVKEEKCASAAICFVSFLPDILDSKFDGRNKYLELLLSVAEKFKRSPYSLV